MPVPCDTQDARYAADFVRPLGVIVLSTWLYLTDLPVQYGRFVQVRSV
jgi:hypothetical protein